MTFLPPTPTNTLFYLNGKRADASKHLSLSLNDYIREHTPFKGTKLACGEGGCGACAVQLTKYNPATDTTHSTSINSCLCPIGTLDGVSITTVEGLGNSAAGFSSVQEEFAKHHASQCGYCTPGFVVACHATLSRLQEEGAKPTSEAMMQGLDGNLCRCTGYFPIIDACKKLVTDVEDICAKPPTKVVFPEELKRYVRGKSERSPQETSSSTDSLLGHGGTSTVWRTPTSLKELFRDLGNGKFAGAVVLAGNTASGVYHEWPEAPVIINLKGVKELVGVERSEKGLEFGAAVPFAEVIGELRRTVDDKLASQAWLSMASHIERIAGSHVRWAATPGGNLALLHNPDYYLESDFATVLMGAGGSIQLGDSKGFRWVSVEEFLKLPNQGLDLGLTTIITKIFIPTFPPGFAFWSHKVAQRYYNSHALVNLAISAATGQDGLISSAKIAAGCPTLFREGEGCEAKVAWQLRRAHFAEKILESVPVNVQTLIETLEAFQKDICPGSTQDAPAEFYRRSLEGLLFQGLVWLLPKAFETESEELKRLLSPKSLPPPSVPAGRQIYQQPPVEQHPVGLPIDKDRIRLQASGEAVYCSDVGLGSNQLYACVVPSREALATIENIDTIAALETTGVVAFVGPEDVPGENKVFLGGGDAEIFASKKTEYLHQPLGLIVADSPQLARKAAGLIKVKYGHPKELGQPIFTIKDAIKADSFFEVPDGAGGKVHRGDVKKAMAAADYVIKNAKYRLPSQQHFYMETQVAVAEPQEGGTFLVHSSTQSLDGVQSAVARALGIPAHCITAVCRRAGGGFGGKVARSMPVAAAAAVAAKKTSKAVQYQLSRNEDFCMNGGRSETEIEYDVGFDGKGNIVALSLRGWFLAGADIDLAWNDMMIMQTGADQVYDIPNIDLDLKVVRTNLPPRSIMRGPGFMNAVMVIEQVLEHVASHLGLDPALTRSTNFLKAPSVMPLPLPQKAGYTFKEEESAVQALKVPYMSSSFLQKAIAGICARAMPRRLPENAEIGDTPMMKTSLSRPFSVESWTLPRIWDGLLDKADYHARCQKVEQFNKQHTWRKRGISINPCRFDSAPQPITAHVSIYYDGSILVTHGGLEVGQGLSTKVKQMATFELSKLLPKNLRPLPLDLIRINDTRSDIVPNSGPTWSSTGSEASCAAIQDACQKLVKALAASTKDIQADSAEEFWKNAVSKIHTQVGYVPASVPLSAQGFFDGTASNSGTKEAMVYSSFGAAISEVELDVLTGEKLVLRSDIHFDCGQSLNPMIDMGQVEGAFIQGLGYLTSEDVVYDELNGRLVTNGTWKYKPPSAACVPQQMFVEFLKDSPNPKGVMSSKASGEPSLLLSTSILYALRHAVVAARSALLSTCSQSYQSPLDRKSIGIQVNSGVNRSNVEEDFFILSAPATTTKLKQACGGFSVVDLLKSVPNVTSNVSTLERSSSWVKIDSQKSSSLVKNV